VSSDDLLAFYADAYTSDPARGELGGRWRALGAVGKADHVLTLLRRARLRPQSVLDIGCGDGALLSELQRRGLAGRLEGVEIVEAAAQLARSRPGIDAVRTFDGAQLPYEDGTFALGVLSHVLEHVHEPAVLLAEAARACHAVIVEVPLEANISARRGSKRAGAAEVGHLQRFSRADVRALLPAAGLQRAAELDDPLPLAVHRFDAHAGPARVRATGKWALRAGLHTLAPGLARSLFTVHYACLGVR
jgi:SAM-dependent methyltransferase